MSSQVDIERALEAIAATLNEQQLDGFQTRRVQKIVTQALGGAANLEVDDGGGLHDDSGARVGTIRRTPSGEWITEPQNDGAHGSETEIPAKAPEGTLKKLKRKLPGP
jgi:hypothetical protein